VDLCKHGHVFTPENTYINSSTGRRYCRACVLKRAKVWTKANPAKVSETQRNYRITHPLTIQKNKLKKAGFTPASFSEKLAEQEQRCAICQRIFTEGIKPNADHEHVEPPIPRGILCRECNLGLGLFYDNMNFLEAAAKYLKRYGNRLCVGTAA
jgi:hypothetical protein